MKTVIIWILSLAASLGSKGVQGISLESVSNKNVRAPCIIALDQTSSWPSNPPIITDLNDDPIFPEGSYQFDDRVIEVVEGDSLRLACSGTGFNSFPGDEYAIARCIGGSQFDVSTASDPNAGPYNFDDLGCQQQPDSTSFEPGSFCGPSGEFREVELGFTTDAGFEETIVVCFDQNSARTLYSMHILYKEIIARDTGNDRPPFDPDGYFDFDVDNAYSSSTQLDTVAKLVGSSALASQYIRPSENYFMSRGHMAPNADFVYYSWQDSTFFFINVAPQWQVFNGGNWNILENSIRNFVEDRQIDLVIYTGTHGVMQLEDINGQKVEIYLNPEDGNELPAPKYYWKVLVDPLANTGVAFVGVNNPHINDNEIDSFKICQPLDNHPIMDSISKPDDIKNGVTFACLVQDVADVFDEVPDLGNLGLLS